MHRRTVLRVTVCWILIQCMLLSILPLAAVADKVQDPKHVMSGDGFDVFLESYEIYKREDNDSSLRVYARLVNKTAHRIWVSVENA